MYYNLPSCQFPHLRYNKRCLRLFVVILINDLHYLACVRAVRPHACEGPPVRAVSGRGNSAAPWAWDAGSRKRGSWSLKRYLPTKEKGNESLPMLQLRNTSYTAAQSKRRRIRLHALQLLILLFFYFTTAITLTLS